MKIPTAAIVLATAAATATAVLAAGPKTLGPDARVASVWTVPNATQPSFATVLSVGQAVEIAWKGSHTGVAGAAELWLTPWDDDDDGHFAQLLAEHIDLAVAGAFRWTVRMPPSQLDATPRYRLTLRGGTDRRDRPDGPDGPDGPDQTELPSPGILILPAAHHELRRGLQTIINATCGGSLTCLGSIFGNCCSQHHFCGSTSDYCGVGCLPDFGDCFASTDAGDSTGNSTGHADSADSAGLSTAAQAGIGAGVAVVVIGLGVVAWFVWRRRRRTRQWAQQQMPTEMPMVMQGQGQGQGQGQMPGHMPGQTGQMSYMPGTYGPTSTPHTLLNKDSSLSSATAPSPSPSASSPSPRPVFEMDGSRSGPAVELDGDGDARHVSR